MYNKFLKNIEFVLAKLIVQFIPCIIMQKTKKFLPALSQTNLEQCVKFTVHSRIEYH